MADTGTGGPIPKTYSIDALCGNCDAKEKRTVPFGTKIKDLECNTCGCKTLTAVRT